MSNVLRAQFDLIESERDTYRKMSGTHAQAFEALNSMRTNAIDALVLIKKLKLNVKYYPPILNLQHALHVMEQVK